MSLIVKDLSVLVNGKAVLHDVSLTIEGGETHVLLGPNASGKTTLALTIMGHPAYKVTKGQILFDGQDLADKSIAERAKMGIAIAYQNPPEVRGVKLRDIIRVAAGKEPWDPFKEAEETVASRYLAMVGLDPASFLGRDLNIGFSGGERKRSELAQVFAMRPRLMILDEPDSGVDIDSLRLIGGRTGRVIKELGSSVLIITHHRHILRYLEPDVAHVMYEGRILSTERPEVIIPAIEELGYEGYVRELSRGRLG